MAAVSRRITLSPDPHASGEREYDSDWLHCLIQRNWGKPPVSFRLALRNRARSSSELYPNRSMFGMYQRLTRKCLTTSVHTKDLPTDEASLVGAEKSDQSGHLVRSAVAF